MKTNTTKNLASAAMLVIVVPFLTLAMLVSVKSSGMVENDVLLLLLTLSGAVLSGVNGFGRRTAKASPLSPAQVKSAGRNVHSHS
jgi:positive regulator of sigma E activity